MDLAGILANPAAFLPAALGVDDLLPNEGPSPIDIDVHAVLKGEAPVPTAEQVAIYRKQVEDLRKQRKRMMQALEVQTVAFALLQAAGRQTVNENGEMIKTLCEHLGPKKDSMAHHVRDYSQSKANLAERDAELAEMMQLLTRMRATPEQAAAVGNDGTADEIQAYENTGAGERARAETDGQDAQVFASRAKTSRRRGRGRRRQQ